MAKLSEAVVCVSTRQYTLADVLEMTPAKFQRIFGFTPADALEQKWFAVNGKRLDPLSRAAIEAGVLNIE